MIPKIALTYTNNEVKHANYVRWLQAAGEVDILTISPQLDNLHLLQECQGLVFSGGTDVHPSYYGRKKRDYPNAPKHFDRKRDKLEAGAFEISLRKKMPVLAICRGMQLANCLLGGTLLQDLGKNGNIIHKAVKTRDKAHAVEVVESSLLFNITRQTRMMVNAAHHQAVHKLAPDLRINAVADDGTIEGVEWLNPAGKPFFLGVQWHPERMFAFGLDESPASAPLRTRFLEEVKKYGA